MSSENHFMAAYPTIVYRTVDGVQEAYAPPIPAKPAGQPILHADVPSPGAYPDNVVADLLRERNQYKMLAEDYKASADEGWNQQVMYMGLYEDQLRLVHVLKEKLRAYELAAGYQAESSSAPGQ